MSRIVNMMVLGCAALVTSACAPEESETAANVPVVDTGVIEEQSDEEPPPATPTLSEALGDFGNCMSIEVWIKTDIYRLYRAQTEDGQQCQACHSDGTGGAALSDDVLWTFEEHARMPSIMRLVTGTVDERGNFAKLVPSNRYVDKGIGACPEGTECHPRYTLPDGVQQALATFVEESLNRWEDGSCRSPYVVD